VFIENRFEKNFLKKSTCGRIIMSHLRKSFAFLSIGIIFSLSAYAQDIHTSVAKGDFEKVKALLENVPDLVKQRNQNYETPLILAAKYGHLEIVRLLISRRADINAQDKNGWAPLHYTSWSNSDVAKYLISKGADINLRSTVGESPLFEYINMGNQEMAEFLITQGADINIKNNRGETPLHRAAGEGNKKMVDLLLSRDADVNAITHYNFTPLHIAAVFGHKETVESLIGYGARLNIKSNDGGTPLHFAEAAGYRGIAELLKAKGAENIKRDYLLFKGDYFGLKRPGRIPELFAPHILFNISIFVSMCFSSDGKEVYFSLASLHFNNSKIWFMRQEKGLWLPPRRASFSGKYSEGSPFLSPDGKRLFFYSDMPLKKAGPPKKDLDIWMVERKGNEWGEPINLGLPVNTERIEAAPFVSKGGDLYFHRFDHQGKGGSDDIFKARLDDHGNYSILEELDDLNTEFGDSCPQLSPDESFIIFHSDRPGGHNCINDLYISFFGKDGIRSAPINIGETVNFFPSMSAIASPDGKYLFFFSMRNESWGTFWVDAEIIEDLKPKQLK
jgi:ankyrin repeat protein